MSNTPRGWYPNPEAGPDSIRYWDGEQWTRHVATQLPDETFVSDDGLEVDITQETLTRLRKDIAVAKAALEHVRTQIFHAEDEKRLNSSGFYENRNKDMSSSDYAKEIESVRTKAKEIIRLGNGVTYDYTDTSGLAPRHMKDIAEKMGVLSLRSYNNEIDFLVATVSAENVNQYIAQADNATRVVSELSGEFNIKITQEYHELRKREVFLRAKYLGAL